jgi:hypothetical protein
MPNVSLTGSDGDANRHFLLIVIIIDFEILFLYNDAKGLKDELNKLDE